MRRAAHRARQTTATHAVNAPPRARSSGGPSASSTRYSGNQAALRRLSRTTPHIQYKLTIGAANDPLEAEADRVADQVMRMPASSSTAPAVVQRKCAACEEEEKNVQKKSDGRAASAGEAPPIVHDVLGSSGQPLDAATRAFFEPKLGADFSRVQVHTDPVAASSAGAINALAYTSGAHIAFSSGSYAPGTEGGNRLLAHELTHVIQQGAAIARGSGPLRRSPVDALVQRDDPDAGVPQNPPAAVARDLTQEDERTCSSLYTQKLCVYIEAGLNGDRSGVPDDAEMQRHNATCRRESGYPESEPDVRISDAERAMLQSPKCQRGSAPVPPPADAYVCGRDLNYPLLNLVFGHSYVSAPPYNYGIVAPLCTPTDGGSNSLVWGGTAAHKRDDSCDPGAAVPHCVPCRSKAGVTDVKKCLRDAYTAYNSPTMHKALGPNSNTFAYTLANTCCANITTSSPFPGSYPGWGDPPAPARAATCPPGPPDCS